MIDEHNSNPPEGPLAPTDGSSSMRDEGDSAVPEPDLMPSPQWLADAIRRYARNCFRDGDRALEVAGLISSRGYDAGTVAALLENADDHDERAGIEQGIARLLRRLKDAGKETP